MGHGISCGWHWTWFKVVEITIGCKNLVGGWPTPLKNDGVIVSWDDDIPNWMDNHKFHVPNHQPGHVCALIFLKILLECFFNRFWLPFIATPQCHEGTIVYFICSAKIGKVFAVLNPKRIPTFKSIKNGAPQICVLIYMTPHLTSSKSFD